MNCRVGCALADIGLTQGRLSDALACYDAALQLALEQTEQVRRGYDGVILYDGACGICNRGAHRFERLLRRRDFNLLPLQSPEAVELSGATTDQLMTEVHLVTPAHETLRGVDAILARLEELRTVHGERFAPDAGWQLLR